MIAFIITGAEHKHLQKTRHFKNISSMEPLIKCLELEDEAHNHSTKQCSEFAPIIGNNNEEDPHDLFNFVKRSIPSDDLVIRAENLLFDYIEQSIEEDNVNVNCSKKLNFCKVVEDWIQGQPQERYLGWEVKEGRHVYISDMEKCGEWKNFDQETEQLVLELENDVLTSLVDEIILDP